MLIFFLVVGYFFPQTIASVTTISYIQYWCWEIGILVVEWNNNRKNMLEIALQKIYILEKYYKFDFLLLHLT